MLFHKGIRYSPVTKCTICTIAASMMIVAIIERVKWYA
jgi:hypothetical protein